MAISSERSSTNSMKDLYELKQKAITYYKENGVTQRMEDILNSMFHDNPNDVYGHLANFFEEFSKAPVISKVRGKTTYDSNGYPTIQTDVYCVVKNKEQVVCRCVNPRCVSLLAENAKQDEREAENAERLAALQTAIGWINSDICNKLEGIEPTKQAEIDAIAYDFVVKVKEEQQPEVAEAEEEKDEEEQENEKADEAKGGKKPKSPRGKGKSSQVVVIPDETREVLLPGSAMVSAVSQAVCTTASLLKQVPLYEHIASLATDEIPSEYHMPLPMVSLIHSGRTSLGKLNCVKEFMIVPKPGMSMKEAVEKILAIHHHIGKTLVSKGGTKKGQTDNLTARNVNELGSFCPTFDKPEQGLDLIQDAMSALHLTPGDDFNIALNIAGHEIFDADKGKYEVMVGQLKSPEDLVDFWSELLGRYPAVNVIIDPMRKEDRECWLKLCEIVTSHCYVVGDYGYHRAGLLKDEDLADEYREYKTSAVLLRFEEMNTVTDITQCAKTMKDEQNDIVIGSSHGESTDEFIVDLAVGLNAKYLKIGGPIRGERICKLNRLLQISDDLEEKGMLGYQNEHSYIHIEIPAAEESEQTEDDLTTAKKDTKKK